MKKAAIKFIMFFISWIVLALLGVILKGLIEGWLLPSIKWIKHSEDLYPFVVQFFTCVILILCLYFLYRIIFLVLLKSRQSWYVQSLIMGLVAVAAFSAFSGFTVGFSAVWVSLSKGILSFLPIFIMGAFLPIVQIWINRRVANL